MRFVWFLAWRHLRYRRTQSLSAVLGVAVGMMVLITALSLFNGFTQGLLDATLRATPHLLLLSLNPDQTPPPPPADPRVQAQVPFLAGQSLITRRAQEGRSAGVAFATLLGLGDGGAAVFPQLQLQQLRPDQVLLGESLARNLGAFVGDSLFALSINQKRVVLQVAGTFSTGNEQIDAVYAFTTLENVREMLQTPQALSGYQLRLFNPELAPQVGQDLSGDAYFARPWQNLNRLLIEQLSLQKRVAGIVVFLIVAVAVLGMANVLVLSVIEKTPEIAVLRVMGAGAKQVAGVFALEGVVLGTAGVLLGNLLGFALCSYFAWQPLAIPGDLYFLNQLGVQMRPSDFVWVSLLSFVVVLLASLLPLLRALRIKPGLVLR